MSMSRSLQLIQTLPIGNLEAYIHRTNQIPMLSEEEEKNLAKRWHDFRDIEAARQLVASHLRFVVKIARSYTGYGLPLADLIQEGNVGLMKAVKRFDPTVGVRLVSFAVHWIKAEIHEFILRNWRIVKVATTKAQRKLFFNLRNAKKTLAWFSPNEREEVAKELKVSPREVELMEARMSMSDIGFEAPLNVDEEDNKAFVPAQYLEDTRYEPAAYLEADNWSEQGKEKLGAALELLDARSQDIIQQRWLAEKKATLHELAAKYHVSAERIRQLEIQAIQKLRQAFKE